MVAGITHGARRLAMLLVATALLAGSTGPGGPNSAITGGATPPSGGRFTLSLPVNPAELTPAGLGLALDAVKAAGATQVSAGAVWWFLSPAPGTYDWSSLDRLLAGAASRGLTVSLALQGTPDWVHPELVSAVPDRWARIWYPPRTGGELAQWAQFVGDLARHVAGRVQEFTIWNEPNIVEFWKPAPSPGEYVNLLRVAYAQLKSVDPKATVLFGGLNRNDIGYLRSYYLAAAGVPGAAASRYFFDELDVHPYSDARSPDDTSGGTINGPFGPVNQDFGGLALMKQTMDARGDQGKGIAVGEYGFSTSNTWMHAVPDALRALYAKRALADAASLPYVTEMSWYTLLPTSADGPEWAILTTNFQPSATYRALQQAMGNGPKSTPDSAASGTASVVAPASAAKVNAAPGNRGSPPAPVASPGTTTAAADGAAPLSALGVATAGPPITSVTRGSPTHGLVAGRLERPPRGPDMALWLVVGLAALGAGVIEGLVLCRRRANPSSVRARSRAWPDGCVWRDPSVRAQEVIPTAAVPTAAVPTTAVPAAVPTAAVGPRQLVTAARTREG